MTSEPQPIRVKPLSRMVDGEDPAEFMLRLTGAGYNRFYVHVPEGFRCDFKEPGHLFAHRLRHEQDAASSSIHHHGEPSYLQLDEQQVQKLIEHPPIALYRFSVGALFRRLSTDGRPSIDFDYQSIRQGTLEPRGQSIASATPTMCEPGLGVSVALKALRPNTNMYSYFLHGVNLRDIYVEEAGVTNALGGACAIETEGASPGEGLPLDPYSLEHLSPLVYAILRKAYKNRGKARGEIDTPSLAAEFRELNADYKKNPKPFNDGRHELAATLANPAYNYSSERLREIDPPAEPIEVPSDAFLDQEFINANFKKLLYAACCWNGAQEPQLRGDREKLVDLLVGLGFYDADDSDQVQSLVYFITGEKYRRNKHKSEFRHIRGDR